MKAFLVNATLRRGPSRHAGFIRQALAITAGGVLAIATVGCRSTQHAAYDPVNPRQPYTFPGQTASLGNQPGVNEPLGGVAQIDRLPVGKTPSDQTVAPAPQSGAAVASTLRVGDVVTITFSDMPITHPIPPQKTQIAEDGALTLPYNVRVQAVGKTPRQLEQEIRGEYVPNLYRHLTVTVQTEQRAFFVGGEVKLPNRIPFVGEMTVSRAIQAAGDFTDFANRKKIELIRENGEKHQLNWFKIIKNPKLDLPVFPNDQIIVHQRTGLWW